MLKSFFRKFLPVPAESFHRRIHELEQMQRKQFDLLKKLEAEQSSLLRKINGGQTARLDRQDESADGAYEVPDELEASSEYLNSIPNPGSNKSSILRNEAATRKLLEKRTARTLLRFEVSVADHCNLNCCGCSHFSPVSEKSFLDPAEYERDCHRLSKLFFGEMEFVKLMGGEPLLHPHISEIIRVTRENFPCGQIQIVSNGLLIPGMDEFFWEACRRYNAAIHVTKYPVAFDYDSARQLTQDNGVPFFFYNDASVEKTFRIDCYDLQGLQNTASNFNQCFWSNACITLRNGRLFTCSIASYAHILKEHYHLDLCVSERNSIDIYKADSAEEILTYLTHPIPFCRYCDFRNQVYGVPWSQSKKEITEWVKDSKQS